MITKNKTNTNSKKSNILFRIFLTIFVFSIASILTSGSVSALIELDDLYTDPAIIVSGDEVDVVVQFHSDSSSQQSIYYENDGYTYKVELLADDSLTEEYVTISDAFGDDLHGSLFYDNVYVKKFRVKFATNAPAGEYEFELAGTWYYNDVPIEISQTEKLTLEVKKEGIILDVANLQTNPGKVRPGDNDVELIASVENVGEKSAKGIEFELSLPDGFTASYANNNYAWVGLIGSDESKEINSFIDIDETVTEGVYYLTYLMTYYDEDNNLFSQSKELPIYVQGKPILEVESSIGEGVSGKSSNLIITVKNVGSSTAESVDVRVLKQSSQPFDFDVRSEYVGTLEPGESADAIFEIKVDSNANINDYLFDISLRAKGDSDEGDDSIYTFADVASFSVTGHKKPIITYVGIAVIVIGIGAFVFYKRRKSVKVKRK